ncbi:phospholipase D-like domain-containing protein [Flavobacterium sp. 3HN19-14]|uniref:phospholipase D-like domain-containing protein n=1 Tax=Flavobacterium sp. 3HN19-14 TaxID=3448133 RepID=UPI003EDFC6BF
MSIANNFEAYGTNAAAPFKLKLYRGENMVLLAMNWNATTPPLNFVGFAIEYCEPGSSVFYPLKNRLSFLANDGSVNPNIYSSKQSPIQKFRWAHFPYHPEKVGLYTYRVTDVYMDDHGVLGYGESQLAQIALGDETYSGLLNIAFTRGFVASQAFADRFNKDGKSGNILPTRGKDPLKYISPNLLQKDALEWMGYEARQVINEMLQEALNDTHAEVRVAAYDLDLPEMVNVLEQFGSRLKIIIDTSDKHGKPTSAESHAAARLVTSGAHVQRQKAGGLQHSKFIAVKGVKNVVLGGSTNFSWRGFFVQNNNAIIVNGAAPVDIFFKAFDDLWNSPDDKNAFSATDSADWKSLDIQGIDGKVTFSPHNATNACLDLIAEDILKTKSSLMFSLAFLYQTERPIKKSIVNITSQNDRFVYGISDKGVDGLDIKKPDANAPVAYPATLLKNVPQPFKKEVSGGGGIRMHHKFVVIDFDTEDARVYTGSYNFSNAADRDNAENLWVFRDRKIAVSYMIQAVTMFDHYEWRDSRQKALDRGEGKLYLKPAAPTAEQSWWYKDYNESQRIKDRKLFCK